MDEKFFTTEQVANILQIHPFTVLKFIKQGRLKGIKLGRVYRIMGKDINEFLQARMTGPKNKNAEIYEKPKTKADSAPIMEPQDGIDRNSAKPYSIEITEAKIIPKSMTDNTREKLNQYYTI